MWTEDGAREGKAVPGLQIVSEIGGGSGGRPQQRAVRRNGGRSPPEQRRRQQGSSRPSRPISRDDYGDRNNEYDRYDDNDGIGNGGAK